MSLCCGRSCDVSIPCTYESHQAELFFHLNTKTKEKDAPSQEYYDVFLKLNDFLSNLFLKEGFPW